MKNPKLPLLALVLVVLIFGITGCAKSKGSLAAASSTSIKKQNLIPVRFGSDSSTFSIAFQIAKAKGFFQKNGINPQISTFSYGIDTLNAALTNQVDVGIAADFAALSRFSSGDLKILSFDQQGKPEAIKFIARDGINSPADLKGKTIGVQKGTVGEYILAKYLDKVGIKQDNVKKAGFSSSAEEFAAFEKGDIQAFLIGGVVLDKALKVDGAKVIGSQADIPFAARGFIVAKDEFLKGNPDATKKILSALNEADIWVSKNPSAAAEIESKVLMAPKAGVERELKDQDNDIRLSDEDVQQLADVYGYATTNKLIKGGFNLKDEIDTKPLKEALPSKLTYNPDNIK